MKQIYKRTRLTKVVLTVAFVASALLANAQLNPFATQYFSNQYLGNPALAGLDDGFRVNAGYRQLWNQIPGGPKQQQLTGDYRFKRVGLGINFNAEQMGLHRRARVLGTYAYHLPVANEKELHFGVSLGFMNQRLDNGLLDGDPDDVQVGRYNARETYFDGDFGIAYTDKKINLQFSLPNLRNLWGGNEEIRVADIATFYAAASYQFALSSQGNGIGLEPKAAYRGVKGFDSIWDLGAQLTFANQQVMLMGMYHSSKSSTFGIGMDYLKKYLITAMYTTETSPLAGYTNGNFEIGLRAAFGK